MAAEEVTLGAAGEEDGQDVQTDAQGFFVFEAVEPGSYWLSTGVFAEGADMEDPFGLAWDDPCSAEGFMVLNARLSDKVTGEVRGVVASVSNEETPLQVEAGDRITTDIVFVCGA